MSPSFRLRRLVLQDQVYARSVRARAVSPARYLLSARVAPNCDFPRMIRPSSSQLERTYRWFSSLARDDDGRAACAWKNIDDIARTKFRSRGFQSEWLEKKKAVGRGEEGDETRERTTCDNEKVGGVFIITQSADSALLCSRGNESASSAFAKRHVLITVTSRWPAVLMIIN